MKSAEILFFAESNKTEQKALEAFVKWLSGIKESDFGELFEVMAQENIAVQSIVKEDTLYDTVNITVKGKR